MTTSTAINGTRATRALNVVVMATVLVASLTIAGTSANVSHMCVLSYQTRVRHVCVTALCTNTRLETLDNKLGFVFVKVLNECFTESLPNAFCKFKCQETLQDTRARACPCSNE